MSTATVGPVRTGLRAMAEPVEEFDDRLLTQEQAAKRCNLSVTTFRELVKRQPPLSMWASDITRYAKARKAGNK